MCVFILFDATNKYIWDKKKYGMLIFSGGIFVQNQKSFQKKLITNKDFQKIMLFNTIQTMPPHNSIYHWIGWGGKKSYSILCQMLSFPKKLGKYVWFWSTIFNQRRSN